MSTSATISFRAVDGEEVARIFRQCDGGPDQLGQDLLDFFVAVERSCAHDTRFNDPAYLAAKWVVFDSGRHHRDPVMRGMSPLNFLSVGIVNESWEGRYHYDVRCHGRISDATGEHEYPDVDCTSVLN